MFSFGDDIKKNNEKPEFRITELKSLMRSTFRELYYFENRDDMKKKEDMLFGNKKRKSPISFKLKAENNLKYTNKCMLPHKKQGNMNSIDISSKVNLLVFGDDDVKLDMYIILLIQSSIIGAIGKRSRKGFGSFRITNIKENKKNKYEDLLKKSPIEILEECNIYLKQKYINIYKIRENKYTNDGFETLSFNDCIDKNLDFPYVTRINFIKVHKDKECLKSMINNISKLTHQRVYIKRGERDFISDIQNNGYVKANVLGNYRFPGERLNRFASPISVSFWENDIDRYMIIKELNYKYILNNLEIKGYEAEKANKDYVDKYVNELIKIGGA